MVYELLVQAFRFFIICSIFLLISHSLDDMPHLMQQVTAMRPLRSVTQAAMNVFLLNQLLGTVMFLSAPVCIQGTGGRDVVGSMLTRVHCNQSTAKLSTY